MCTITCRGDNYDVNNDPVDGCERQYTDGAHTQSTAFPLGNVDCQDSNRVTPLRTIYSDSRIHTNFPSPPFNPGTGAAPQWWVVNATGGVLCQTNLDVMLTMTTGTGNCYRLTVNAGSNTWVAPTVNGVAQITQGPGSYIPGMSIFFVVEKICPASIREAANYIITYHL